LADAEQKRVLGLFPAAEPILRKAVDIMSTRLKEK
jgi:hypothetical protein